MKLLLKPNNKNIFDLYSQNRVIHVEDAGFDLYVPTDTTIAPGEVKMIDMGIQCQMRSFEWLPFNWLKNMSFYKYHCYLMYPRSSISKTPLTLANSVGVIDAGYKGNIKAAMRNTDLANEYTVKAGTRLVQLTRPDLYNFDVNILDYNSDSLRQTTRGEGGFGSTGI